LTESSQQPLVSVVIPNYNRVEKLQRAINSVLTQDYTHLEIIIVDDCSPKIDEIKRMLLKFSVNNIIFIENESNLGPGATRNKGILAAKGKYIAFLDSDDTWFKNKISIQVLEAEKYTSDVLIYTKSKKITKQGSKVSPSRGIYDDELVSEYLFVDGIGGIATPSMFIHTEAAKKCLFDESLRFFEDHAFLFRVEKNNVKIVFIDKVLTRVDRTRTSTGPGKDWNPELSIRFINKYREQMSSKSYAYAYFINVVSLTYGAGSKKQSLKYFIKNLALMKEIEVNLILKYFIKLIIR